MADTRSRGACRTQGLHGGIVIQDVDDTLKELLVQKAHSSSIERHRHQVRHAEQGLVGDGDEADDQSVSLRRARES